MYLILKFMSKLNDTVFQSLISFIKYTSICSTRSEYRNELL